MTLKMQRLNNCTPSYILPFIEKNNINKKVYSLAYIHIGIQLSEFS